MTTYIEFTNEGGKILQVTGGKSLVIQQVDKTLEITQGGKQGSPGPPGSWGEGLIDCGTFE